MKYTIQLDIDFDNDEIINEIEMSNIMYDFLDSAVISVSNVKIIKLEEL